MSRFAKALLASLAVHGLLAAALALYLDRLPLLELPRLDLSAVELSFSDEESPAAAPAPPPSEPEPVPPPPEPAPAQARIDAPPSATKPIRPAYPTGARQRREEGDVVLQLSISAHGRVTAASVFSSSGYPELDAAALRAAKKARFVPAKSGRDAVAADARITIEFRLK